MPAGRPSKYKPEFCIQASKLCKLGATDKQLADFFDTSEQTINAWKQAYPEFLESLKEAKDEKDAEVEKSLYERATGYEYETEKIYKGEVLTANVHCPPDPVSMIFWLKNRQPAKWRDKQEHELSGNITVNINLDPKDDSNQS